MNAVEQNNHKGAASLKFIQNIRCNVKDEHNRVDVVHCTSICFVLGLLSSTITINNLSYVLYA